MKRARDVRDQLEGLMDRIEVELCSCSGDTVPIRKVISLFPTYFLSRISSSDIVFVQKRAALHVIAIVTL